MAFDINNLFIAGITNTTAFDGPEIVFAYPAETSNFPSDFCPKNCFDYAGIFTRGDVVLVGPRGVDGLVDQRSCGVYILDKDLNPMPFRDFRWVNKLAVYQPITNLYNYLKAATLQWEANKVVDL